MRRVFTVSFLAILALTASSFADSAITRKQESFNLLSLKTQELDKTISTTEVKIDEITSKIKNIEKNQKQDSSQSQIK